MWSLKLRPLQTQLAPSPIRALSSFKSHGSNRFRRNDIKRLDSLNPKKTVGPPQAAEQQRPDPAVPEPGSAGNPHYDPLQNTLLSPVHIPEDPNGVLKETHPATSILANSGLVVQRELEMMNVLM